MKNAKATGEDNVKAEFIKYMPNVEIIEDITFLFNTCLEKGTVPQEWKDVIITVLYKNKGS